MEVATADCHFEVIGRVLIRKQCFLFIILSVWRQASMMHLANVVFWETLVTSLAVEGKMHRYV